MDSRLARLGLAAAHENARHSPTFIPLVRSLGTLPLFSNSDRPIGEGLKLRGRKNVTKLETSKNLLRPQPRSNLFKGLEPAEIGVRKVFGGLPAGARRLGRRQPDRCVALLDAASRSYHGRGGSRLGCRALLWEEKRSGRCRTGPPDARLAHLLKAIEEAYRRL